MLKGIVLNVLWPVGLVAVGWFSCLAFGPKPKPHQTVAAADAVVSVGTVKAVPFNPTSEYVGHVEAVQETDILPQVEGYVQKVCFVEGAVVSAGDILFEIDPEQYESALELRKSEVNSAEAKVIVASAEVDRATRYYDRISKADDRGVTATERDTAETTLASVRAELNSVKAQVTQAKAALAIAEFNVKHTKVRSPIAGRIGKAFQHVGDLVSASKTPLAHVVQLDPIRVAFPVPDRDYAAWSRAVGVRRLRIRRSDGLFYDEQGTPDFADNVMNRSTATVIMRVSFANSRNLLMPNEFVRVVVDDEKPKSMTAVPTPALVKGESGWSVWVLDGNDVASRRIVQPGLAWSGRTEIRGGLAVGERIVTAGVHKVQPGMRVRVSADRE